MVIMYQLTLFFYLDISTENARPPIIAQLPTIDNAIVVLVSSSSLSIKDGSKLYHIAIAKFAIKSIVIIMSAIFLYIQFNICLGQLRCYCLLNYTFHRVTPTQDHLALIRGRRCDWNLDGCSLQDDVQTH